MTDVRVSQITFNVLESDGTSRVSMVFTGALVEDAATRVSLAYLNVLEQSARARISQVFLQVLVLAYEVPMPSIYPTLKGLTFSTKRKPIFAMEVQQAASMREVRVGFTDFPIWEWELKYTYLPDGAFQGTTSNDLQTMVGFFLSTKGGLLPFLFHDTSDHTVTAQGVGTTDGVSQQWRLFRTYGQSTGSGTEPVGYVNLTQPFNVYLDGVLVNPDDYEVIRTTPYQQQLRFDSVPTTGKIITVDMSYYFYVRFKASEIDMEQFMEKLWASDKITLRSLKG
jgi:uncharacterized protein (TIGR02217 family)